MEKKENQIKNKGAGTKNIAEDMEKAKRTPYGRTRAAVYATGNRWAIENFEATHN